MRGRVGCGLDPHFDTPNTHEKGATGEPMTP